MANAHSTPGFLEMNGSGENIGSIARYDGLTVEYISGGTFGSVYKVELPFSTVVARKVVERDHYHSSECEIMVQVRADRNTSPKALHVIASPVSNSLFYILFKI